jgi:hypothetical protein
LLNEKTRKVNKIILFYKNMDDMMHDVMMMHKRKAQTNLIGLFFVAVTIDTTNREPCPEVPRHGTGERGELADILAMCRSPRHH